MTEDWGVPNVKPNNDKPNGAKPSVQIQHVPATKTSARPLPESQLTPEQRQIRLLNDQLAKFKGKEDPEQTLVSPDQDGENIVIHFIFDGLTALGKTWYRGQELEITVGSKVYNETCDRTGFSWLSLRDDDFAQMDRWGKVYFHSGPWRGKDYKDGIGSFEDLKGVTPPTVEELEAAQELERNRQRAAPLLPRE